MASLINNGAFTFNPEELKDLSRVIGELSYNETIRSLHDVVQGIKYDEQIVFAGRIGLFGKTTTGCTPSAASGLTLTQKFWKPKFIDFRFQHCSASVNTQDKLVQQFRRMNDDFYKITEGSNSPVGDFVIARVAAEMPENILVKAWFGDTAAEVIAEGGVFKAGTDLDLFNSIDGIWKQIFATTSLAPSGKYHVAIAKNAGNSYANQALAAGDSIAAFKALYNKADSRLRGFAGAKFYATRSLYDGLVNDLETVQNAGGFTITNENGMPVVRYRGLEVVMVELWDRIIDGFQNNGTKWNIPHRLVLTAPVNIPIGTLEEGDLSQLDAFYDRTTKQNYIDGIYSLDAKLLEDYMTAVAY